MPRVKCKVVECGCTGKDWYAYLDYGGVWLGWEYEVRLNGSTLRGEGVAVRGYGRPMLKVCSLSRPLPRGAVVDVDVRPVRRLYPA